MQCILNMFKSPDELPYGPTENPRQPSLPDLESTGNIFPVGGHFVPDSEYLDLIAVRSAFGRRFLSGGVFHHSNILGGEYDHEGRCYRARRGLNP